LAASGTGDISSFTTTNTTASAIVSTITVTPSANSCDGSAITFTITVNPTPSIVAQTTAVCSGVAFSVAPANGSGNIVPTGTTYDWSAPSAITGISGLSAAGTPQTTIGGTLSNSTNAPIDVIYSVTPTSGSCDGAAFNVIVTVNPAPLVADQTVTSCSGSAFTAAPTNGSGNIVPSNTTYSWAAPAAVTGITGLASGTTETNFNGNLTNTTNAAIVVTYTVTPTSGTCQGATFDVAVTVDPTPSIADESTAICSGDAFSVVPSSSSASNASDLFISEYVEGSSNNKYIEIFNGTGGSVDLTDYRLRLYSNGANTPNNDVILSGTLANNSTLVYRNSSATAYTGTSTVNAAVSFNGDDAVALYKISSSSFVDVFGRIGDDPGSAWSAGGNSTANKTLVRNSNITGGVTASPTGTGATAFTTLATEWSQSNQDDVSNLGSHTYGTSNSNIIPAAITYSWPAPAAISGISGLASGTNETTIGGTLTNSTNAAIQVTYVVTPTSGSCDGAAFNVTVTVNPTPVVVDQTAAVCTGVAFSVAPANGSGNIVPAGTTYDWSAPSAITGISGLSSGTAETTIGGTLSNSTSAPIDVVYSVTPTSGSCVGSAFNVTVTVNPTPIISDQSTSICSASAYTLAPIDGDNGDIVPSTTTYSWAAPASVIGITGLASGTSEVNFNGTLTNTTTSAISVTYVVTPTNGTCQGASFNVVVTVNPTPVVAAKTATVCSADAFSVVPVDGVSGDIVPAGTTYDWSAPSAVSGITGLSSGTAQSTIGGTLTNTTNAPITVIYSVTPSISNCSGTAFDVSVTVNPVPDIADATLSSCSESVFSFTPSGTSDIIPSGTTYTWTFADNPFVVGEVNQATAQTSLDQTLLNLSSTAQTVVYTVTPTSGTCVGNTFTLSATINPLPVVAAITGASSVCVGSTTVLASSTTGGVWSSSDATVADVSASGVVTGASAGSATITYGVTINGCTTTTSASMTVNASPSATVTASGATTFCAGGTVDLTANAGTSYLWSNGAQTQTITVTTSGSYSVTVTNGSGCSTTSSAQSVTVNPLPTVAAITGSPDVCVGSTTVLASSTTGGVWSTSDATVADVSASGVVTGVSAGSATITYTVTDGNGCTNSTSASVSVDSTPAVPLIVANGPTTICPSSSLTLTAPAGYTYVWSTGDQTASISVNQTDSYTVTVSNAAGCSTTSAPIDVTVEDVTAPTLVVPNDVIVSVNNGCEATVDIGNALAVDNCTLLSLTNDAPAFYPIGTTIVTWTATDASGNVTTLTQEINVVDDINPTIAAPGAVVAYTDANCEATGVDLGTAAASDNCNTGLVVSNDAPVAYPIGLTVVTWTAIDAYGNTSSATQDVNVFDTVSPVIDLVDIDFTLDALGEGNIVFDDIDNGTTDNCGIATITLSQTDFNCDNVGNNVVTVTVTDNSGNVSTEEVNVFVNASAFCGDASWDGPAVPEAFTPNDNGINDYFVVPGLDGYNVRELTVFDRYGGVVYESNLYNNDWDGTNMSGDRLPDATYYYILTITGGKTKAGYVYINRVK
ncbi:MAG: gliding motility-associated C-terminal domain-containing protein, partial [Crocinitomicaceae bacterium]|nr:gliding motility-associated C-terminal domain-containing protein [Crocinitomicaceae bacterium]